MSRYIQIDRRARKDLIRILTWLHSRSPRGADSWHRAFWQAAQRIAADAESFALADEVPRLSREVRQAIFKTRRGRRYRIIFDFNDSDVFILRVRQPGQRPLRSRDLR
jgi:plasmid stabilization system protein ParE